MTTQETTTAGTLILAIPTTWWRVRNIGRAHIARRIAHYLMAYAAGLDAREKAYEEAMKRKVELV